MLRCCVTTCCLLLAGVLVAGIQLTHSVAFADDGQQGSGVSGAAGQENVQDSEPADKYSRTVKADFTDVFSELEFAITEKNYRITGVNSIGRAIADRDDSPFPLASVVHFCNIEAAKQMLDISMDYLLLMPCRVTIQEIADGYVLIEARLLPLDDEKLLDTALSVNALLREIVDFAAGDW